MSKKSSLTKEMQYKSAVKAFNDSLRPRRTYLPGVDEGRTQANGREMDVLEKLVLLDAVLIKGENTMKPRLSTIKNGWRDYKMIAKVMGKLVEKILETCTVRTLERLQSIGENCELSIKPRSIAKDDPCLIIHESALMQLINTTCNAECAICFKHGAEVRGCTLRKTLMEIAPLNDPPKDGRCGYADVMLLGGIDDAEKCS